MKKALRLSVLLFVILFAFVSCDENQQLIINQTTPTPTIRGTVSIPEGAGLAGSDFYVRIMEGEKAVYTGRVNADGSFAVPGLREEASYSILLTTEEPGDIKGTERDISRAASTSGYGGWLSNVTASINEQAGVGSIKVKPLGTIKGIVTKDGAEDGYDTTVYIPGTSYLAMTDGEGNYSIFNVPQATYTLRYISNGYMAKMVSDVVLYSESDTENPVTTVAPQTLIKNAGNLVGTISKIGATDHSNITVMLSDGENVFNGNTAIDGSLMITGITPGTYSATISSSGFVTQTKDNIKIEAAKNTTLDLISLTANGGTIVGSVEMNDGGEKAGVLITAKSSDSKYSYTTSTDTDGKFTIPNAYPETYTLTLTKSNYAIITKAGIQSIAGQTTNAGVFSFSSEFGTIEGTVTDTKGNPIENAIVKIGEITAFTGSNGKFSKTGIGVGGYTVTISKESYTNQTLAQTISVESSETTNIGAIRLSSIYGSISGTVTVNDNGSAVGIDVTATAADGKKTQVKTTVGGAYTIANLTPDNYTVSAEADGYATAERSAAVTADSNTEVDALALTSLSGSLKVTVGYADNANRKDGITVSVYDSADNKVTEATTTDSLTVAFTGIAVGTNYRIIAEAENYASSARTGISVLSALETSLTVSSLTNRYGSVSGRVTDTDETAIENAIVRIGEISVITGADGRFTKSGIAVGNYTVMVSKDDYASKTLSEKITVEASEETEIGTVLLASEYGKLTGLVTVNDGGSVGGISVSAISSNGNYSYSTLTDENGSYVITAVQPGTYTVTVQKTGYSDTTADVEVRADRTATAATVMLLSKHGSVSGKVSLSESADNSGVTVTLTYVADTTIAPATISGADGTYTFSNLTNAGQYTITFSKDGYVSDTGKVVNVTLGQNTRIEDVTLRSLASKVNGKATLEGTEDFTGISVLLKATDNSVQYDATTDQQGNYVMARVNPGEYTFTVSKAGYISKTVNDIIVESSTERTLDTVSLNIGTRSVSGNVTLELRSDYSGALISATNLSDSKLVYSAISNTAGNYTLAGMKPGEYIINVSCAGYNTSTLPTINITEGNETPLDSFELKIARGTISGTATLEGRGTNAGVAVELLKGTDVYASTFTDDSGAYAFNVPQGNYSGVRFTCENFKSVSIAQNIALIANDYVTIGQNAEMIATHVPIVRGRLTVKNLLSLDYSDIAVTLVENGITTTTDKDGFWSFSKVPVGHYTLKFERENTNPVTMAVDIVAAAEKSIEAIELIPNAASIEGNVSLNGLADYSGITVRATSEGMAELSTKTNAAGYFYIGNVVTTETYTVHFEKAGWVSQTREVSGLEDLSINDITEANPVKLMDTTAPVLNSISVTVGNSELEGRKLNVYINATEEGSGISKVYVNTENDFTNVEPINYANPLSCYVEDTEGSYTLYVKVEDESGNLSTVRSQAFSIADYKTVVSSVLVDNEDGTNDGIITWTKNRSPYYVAGSILVDENTTLIIEPGVNVQFSGAYFIQVEGTLKINGTENEKVYLYGVGDGENTWTGIKGVFERGSAINQACISGMADGMQGFLDICNSQIVAASSGFALGGYSLSSFSGTVENSSIVGGLRITDSMIKSSDLTVTGISGLNNVWSSIIIASSLDGRELSISNTTLDNDLITSLELNVNDISSINTLFANCSLSITHGMIYKSELNGCTFSSFSYGSIKDSNIIDCGKLSTSTQKSNVERINLTDNYWGVNNTMELNANGTNCNLSFIGDYYDDFNVTKADLSGYKTTSISDAGVVGVIEGAAQYSIGDAGPAGGIVFYDKGYYSDGWRYLEAARSDCSTGIVFGYYRTFYNGPNLKSGTANGIGFGKINTRILVADMGATAYQREDGTNMTENYAAKICDTYSYGGYSDWFLPSRDELNLMYVNLHKVGLGGLTDSFYWSSSEYCYAGNPSSAYGQLFYNGSQGTFNRYNSDLGVRAIRAF